MVWIAPATFQMGSNAGNPDEEPIHSVTLDGYWIDATEVTNTQFAAFVAATNYVTFAERPPNPEDFPGAPPELLKPGSVIFKHTDGPVDVRNQLAYWEYKIGSDWRHPEGPESNIDDRMDHPVVCVVYEDAAAYAEWAGKQLPSEAQWEYAASGGTSGKMYPWGDLTTPNETWMMNIWQGSFPHKDAGTDGHTLTAPVKSYPPNGFGIYDTSGNVWELCADWYQPAFYMSSPETNPTGPDSSHDPQEPGIPKRVKRGGSWLSNTSTGTPYRTSARHHTSLDTPSNDTGFRCVRSPS